MKSSTVNCQWHEAAAIKLCTHIFIQAARLILYGPTALTSGRSILRSNSPYSRPDHPATTTLGLITWTMVFVSSHSNSILRFAFGIHRSNIISGGLYCQMTRSSQKQVLARLQALSTKKISLFTKKCLSRVKMNSLPGSLMF